MHGQGSNTSIIHKKIFIRIENEIDIPWYNTCIKFNTVYTYDFCKLHVYACTSCISIIIDMLEKKGKSMYTLSYKVLKSSQLYSIPGSCNIA